ncbi:MAG TPA: Ltp family lipoprotein [Clostridia bacterium]|nr:Ltp family lipoprotein [Clostridia bacterium]
MKVKFISQKRILATLMVIIMVLGLVACSGEGTSTASEKEESLEEFDKENAKKLAEENARYSNYSKTGLIELLEYEGLSSEAAKYGVESIEAGLDWKERAKNTAETYLTYQAASEKGLREVLEYEGFEKDQVEFAIKSIEVDWKEQARKKALNYLEFQEFTKDDLIVQLIYEGFSEEEAKWGVSKSEDLLAGAEEVPKEEELDQEAVFDIIEESFTDMGDVRYIEESKTFTLLPTEEDTVDATLLLVSGDEDVLDSWLFMTESLRSMSEFVMDSLGSGYSVHFLHPSNEDKVLLDLYDGEIKYNIADDF